MKGIRIFMQLLPAAYMLLIWYLSSRDTRAVIDFGRYDALIKESLHLIEFGLLYALWVLALLAAGRFNRRTNGVVLAVTLLYAALDEWHQAFVPARTPSLVDLFKDFAGVAVVAWLVGRSYFNRRSRVGRILRLFEERLRP